MKSAATPPPYLLLACCKCFIASVLTIALMGLGMASGQEKETAAVPQQGVELLFPAGTGKQAKGAKLSKEQKEAASLLQKLKAIEKGGDINATDKQGQTALMHAAAQNNRLAVCWLVAKSADASIKSKKGKTAGSVAHGDMREFLTALEKEKQPLSRQEAQDMYAYRGITPGKIGNGLSSGEDAILQLRGAKAEDLSKLKNKEWKMEHFQEDPMTLALLYRIGARKFSFPENLSSVKTEQLQLLRALGVKTDIVELALQMRIALQLKQKETVLALLKQDSTLLQNPEILSFISDAKTLQALLDAGLDAKNEKLMEAVINKGDGAMLRTLLKAGATLQDPDKILKEYSDQSADFVLALIDAGTKADVNTLPVRMSPCDYTRLQYKVNATLLHQAANRVDLTDVQLLLAHGADPNTPGKKVRDGQEEPYGMTPLMAAANSLDVEEKVTLHTSGSVGLLLSSVTRKNATHRTEIVRRLLDAGADVHVKDSAGNGVIYYAVCGAFYEGAPLYLRESKKAEADILLMVELLIKAGADVPKDILARDALRSDISRAGREKLALMLLDAGADPLARKKDSWTAGWTTLMINGIYGPKIAKRLLDAGVDPTVKCEETSAMSLAMEQGAVEVVKLLKEKGIAPGELRVVSPETTKFLLELGARIPKDMTDRIMDDLYSRYAGGEVPAKLSEDYIDIIQILKRHGYKPELMTWTKKDHSNSRSFNTEAFRAFLKAGENPNEVDENGNSLLANFICSTKLSFQVAEVLPAFIEAGVDLNLKNKDGKTVLQLAKEQKLEDDVIKLLQEYGAKE